MTLTATVVICTHDRPGHLRRSVAAVLDQARRPDELIVVKDAPGQVEPDIARQAAAVGVDFTAVNTDMPSLPASRNRGMDLASGDIVLLLDDDMMLGEGFLAELLALYEADTGGQVAGIGATPERTVPRRWPERMWDFLASAMGGGRWLPRRWAGRDVALPAALRGRLVAVRRLAGGTISLRKNVAKTERFDESFAGYALGEDREFCYRVGARHALLLCPSLSVAHDSAPAGRPDSQAMGRMYVAHMLHIGATSVGGGAGTYLIMACELAGMFVLHAAWLLPGRTAAHWGFLVGVTGELIERLGRSARRCLCGS